MDWMRPISISSRLKGLLGRNKSVQAVAVISLLLVIFSVFLILGQLSNSTSGELDGCHFPAIFNFGDSNSDTGGKSAAFHRLHLPNGNTFFHKPSGRYSDGLVLLDVLARKLGLPFLSAYLDSIGTNFRHGANFATGGSTIQPVDTRIFEGGFSPISLDLQLEEFEQFKERATELSSQERSLYAKNNLPRPEEFSKALYTIDIGQNDLHAGFKSMTEKQVLESIPKIIVQLGHAIERLHQQGARFFWIHNTGPIGCLPYTLIYYPPKPENTDQSGCVKSHNEVAQEFNRQLKERVSQLRGQLPDVVLTYVDVYSAKYSLINEAKKYGFTNPLGYCCGHIGDYRLPCGKKATLNGKELYGASCSKPETYISWDAIHYSHAANIWIADRILDGSHSDPPIPVTEACHKPVNMQT